MGACEHVGVDLGAFDAPNYWPARQLGVGDVCRGGSVIARATHLELLATAQGVDG